MKLGTHRIVNFALAITLYPALQLGWGRVAMMAAAAILADTLIDGVGHRRHKHSPIPSRAWWTHHPITAAVTGGMGGAGIGLVVSWTLAQLGIQTAATLPIFPAVAGVVAGEAHLLLDLPTGSGIYLTRTRRLGVGHSSWDNAPANVGLSLLALLLIIVTYFPPFLPFLRRLLQPFGLGGS